MTACPCNLYPLISHFYVVSGIRIFIIYIKNIDCGYSLEPPFLKISTFSDNIF